MSSGADVWYLYCCTALHYFLKLVSYFSPWKSTRGIYWGRGTRTALNGLAGESRGTPRHSAAKPGIKGENESRAGRPPRRELRAPKTGRAVLPPLPKRHRGTPGRALCCCHTTATGLRPVEVLVPVKNAYTRNGSKASQRNVQFCELSVREGGRKRRQGELRRGREQENWEKI